MACLMFVAGCACITPSYIPTTVPEVLPGILQGYLALNEAPDSLTLLPAPPDKESAAFAADQEAFRAGLRPSRMPTSIFPKRRRHSPARLMLRSPRKSCRIYTC
jgi:hypothetical protein